MSKKEKIEDVEATENMEEVYNEAEEREKEINARIDSLFGMSDRPIKKHKELSPAEKKKIRKNMVLLIWYCVLMSGLIILNTFNPISKLFDKEKPVAVKKEVLPTLPSGNVPLENDEIVAMINMFKFDVNNPLYEINIVKLFTESKKVNEVDFQLQMFLLTSTDSFNKYLYKNTKLKDYDPKAEQNLNITISAEKIEKFANTIFNQEIKMNFENFKYYYNFGEDGIVYFDVSLTDGIYTFIPIEPISKSNITAYFKTTSATNIDNEIYIKYNVLFVKDNGIYSDCTFQKLLSNNIDEVDSYYNEGIMTELVFKRMINTEKNAINYKFNNIVVANTNG